ncbi:hypothetical protein [Bacillus sp. AK128]
MQIVGRIVMMSIYLVLFISSTAWAAADPIEVEEMKRNAPVQLIGKVVEDELDRDLTVDQKYSQIRRMTLQVHQIIKAPYEIETVDVFYTYIPAWQANQYAGGNRVDVVVGDVIEIWLETGKDGFEPVLGGDTIEHLAYVKDRVEPIPEPVSHQVRREVNQWLDTHLSTIVFGAFMLLVILIIWAQTKKNKSVN